MNQDFAVVFVGGVGRSGTSLVYRSLVKCDAFYGIPNLETKFIIEPHGLIDLYFNYVHAFTPSRFGAAASAFHRVIDRKLSEGIEGVPDEFRDRVRVEAVFKLTNQFVKNLYSFQIRAEGRREAFRREARELIAHLFAFEDYLQDGMIFVEKTPHNLICFHKLKEVFPEARLIHVVRDPRAIAESLCRQSWGPNTYNECVGWVKSVLNTYQTLLDNDEIVSADVLELRLEDLVYNHKILSSKVLEFVGADRNAQLDLRGNAASLDGWWENVSPEELDFGTRAFSEELEMYGYPTKRYDLENFKNSFFKERGVR